jgi:threonine/homoserine/homoserine lactone efflux protein
VTAQLAGFVLAGNAVLASIFWTLGALWYVAVVLAIGRIEPWLARRRVRRTIAGASGGVLVGVGVALAVRG